MLPGIDIHNLSCRRSPFDQPAFKLAAKEHRKRDGSKGQSRVQSILKSFVNYVLSRGD